MEQEKKLLCDTIDLDLLDDSELADLYLRAKETSKYLNDFCTSLELRVKGGAQIPNMKLVEGKSMRYITNNGAKVLEKMYGEKIYSRKIIGITELEKMVGLEKMSEFSSIGVIATKTSAPVVIVETK